MKFKAFSLGILLLFLASPIFAEEKLQAVMATTEVSTSGGAVSKTITNPYSQTGYLFVKTENETATATLAVTVYNSSTLGDVLVCTLTDITTETTSVALLGSTVAAAGEVLDACDFPMGRQVKYTFTVSGAGADFDVTADMEWVK
jgi:hypothetical protein